MKKKKIVKYVAGILLVANVGLPVGISICDSNIDHTKELCPLTEKIGVNHQVNQMRKDYEEQGIDAIVYLEKRLSGEYEEVSLNSNESVSYINDNGHIVYTSPMYYPVKDSDGTIKFAYEIGNPTVNIEIIDDYVIGYRYGDKQEDAIKLKRNKDN